MFIELSKESVEYLSTTGCHSAALRAACISALDNNPRWIEEKIAFAEGRDVEYKLSGDTRWHKVCHGTIEWTAEAYRIKRQNAEQEMETCSIPTKDVARMQQQIVTLCRMVWSLEESCKAKDDEIMLLKRAARLCRERGWMVSGSLEMAECDAFCKSVGLEPWTWRR